MKTDLKCELQEMLDCGTRENQSKYWYPLSVPSYGAEEVISAVESMCAFETTMGIKTAQFEDSFRSETGVGQAVMVNSGSSADLLIAFALVNPTTGLLQSGDEVLVPSVTWPTQIWSLMMAGLKVRLVDTDPATLSMSMDDLEDKVWTGTKGLSIVHLMGNPCNMDRVMRVVDKHKLVLVEDCCEAFGASWDGCPVGSFGEMSAFSFFFSHHLTTMEGGMVCANHSGLADVLRLLRSHGWEREVQNRSHTVVHGIDPRYTFSDWGFNVRPTEVQAAFGIKQILKWPEFQHQRMQNMLYARKVLAKYSGALCLIQETAFAARPSPFALPFMVAEDAPFTRDTLTAYLEEHGVETRPIVAGNIARQPAWERFRKVPWEHLPGADAVHEHGFYVGLHPFDMTATLDELADCIGGFLLLHVRVIDGGKELRMPLIVVEEAKPMIWDDDMEQEAPMQPPITCPKCNADRVYTKYLPPTPSVVVGGVIKTHVQPERLKRECGVCGYYWYTSCDDAMKAEEVTTIGGTNLGSAATGSMLGYYGDHPLEEMERRRKEMTE